jgi:hypothetical protein
LVRSFAAEPENLETEDIEQEDAPIVLERPITEPSVQGSFFFAQKIR